MLVFRARQASALALGRGEVMSYHWNVRRRARSTSGNTTSSEPLQQSRRIQLRKMLIGGTWRDVAVRLVESDDRLNAACSLINDRYVRKGWGNGHRIPESAHHMTFTAEVDGEVVGTITLAVDSARGLAADKTFRDALDGFRAQPGSHICELTKFAFSDNIQSKELMAALFHIVFVYGHRTHGCTDLLIEVHPRHVRFYAAMLGFEPVGTLRVNESVGVALQLMSLKVANIRENVDLCAAKPGALGTRSLYPLFFSPSDENGIYARLARAPSDAIAQPRALEQPTMPSITPGLAAGIVSPAAVSKRRGTGHLQA